MALRNFLMSALKRLDAIARRLFPWMIEYAICFAGTAFVSAFAFHGKLNIPDTAIAVMAGGIVFRYYMATSMAKVFQPQAVPVPPELVASLLGAYSKDESDKPGQPTPYL